MDSDRKRDGETVTLNVCVCVRVYDRNVAVQISINALS